MSQRKSPLECLEGLRVDVDNRKEKMILSFEEFLELARSNPQRVFRNIFQLFCDMVESRVTEEEDEYPGDPESIGFVEYDCSRILATGKDNPFFPDRLFANRFVRQIRELMRGSQQNRIYVYEGPPGCGKSTFLDNLLQTFEEYVNTEEGRSFEVFWEIAMDSQNIEVPCPSHDYPLLIIPKNYRVDFLDKLLADAGAESRHKFANNKEYEWLLAGEACTICQSLFQALCDKLGHLDEVLGMIKVRPYQFNRKTGEGISVFNPGDVPSKDAYLGDAQIQKKLDKICGANRIKYKFSQLAKVNNGIYALVDIKSHNEERLLELHNVISEGVHKVGGIEERVNSLFLALMNPEDMEKLKEKKVESFLARIRENKISFVMEAPTEVKIYRSIFGNDIELRFLPRVLENFARVIISSRMESKSEPLKEWIPEAQMNDYSARHYCDANGILLRMEIYGGIIPSWLSEEDKKKFTKKIRRNLIAEAVNEGKEGFSGRDSIRAFGDFLSLHERKPDEQGSNLITMADVVDFFLHKMSREHKNYLKKGFIGSLVDWYNYTVLGEVKEALYFYNEEQIQEDILAYLCAINYDPDGRKVRCDLIGKEIEVTIDFLKLVCSRITGQQASDSFAISFAQETQKKYTEVIARERGKAVVETELYKELFNSYARNLKEKALVPFVGNKNFREAVMSFGTRKFGTFDVRLKEHITHMLESLESKFGYTLQGAKEICLYVLDQNLPKKFS